MSDDDVRIPAYPVREGKLLWLEPAEAELIAALRADPDQERHIADVDASGLLTIRHPITERLQADALFECPVLWYAMETLPPEAKNDARSRWRLDEEGEEWEPVDLVPRRVPAPTGERVRHNHVTRDIKPPGQCPACDLYHERSR